MANDNQTALQQSIQRKKDKIMELEFEQRALRNFSEVTIMQNSVSDRIKLLNELITEDEKLLYVLSKYTHEDLEAIHQKGFVIEMDSTGCAILTTGGTLIAEAFRDIENDGNFWDCVEQCIDLFNQKYGTDETT